MAYKSDESHGLASSGAGCNLVLLLERMKEKQSRKIWRRVKKASMKEKMSLKKLSERCERGIHGASEVQRNAFMAFPSAFAFALALAHARRAIFEKGFHLEVVAMWKSVLRVIRVATVGPRCAAKQASNANFLLETATPLPVCAVM